MLRSCLPKKITVFLSLAFLLLLWHSDLVKADYMTSDQCSAQGGSCNWISNNCESDQDAIGLCSGGALSQGACCKKKLVDTSGADFDPIGAGLGAGGVLTNPNEGLGGPMGGTVTPGTSGIPTTSSGTSTTSTTSGSENTGGLVPCNNKCTLCHLIIGFEGIFKWLRDILFVVSILFITLSGVIYMVSSGNKGLMDFAKKAISFSLMGFALFLLSWLIVASILTALGYNQAGSWSTFTCDTQQSSGPSLPTNTTAQPGQQQTQSGQTNTAQGDGTCGGIKVAQNSDQCKSTSAQLDSVLNCINGRMAYSSYDNNLAIEKILGIPNVLAAGGAVISSLGQNQNGGNWQACIGSSWSSANCAHAQNSCHYGGTNCQGQINAADLTGDMGAISSAAQACGADTVIYNGTAYYGGNSKSASDHYDHVHISVNNAACGCDYLR